MRVIRSQLAFIIVFGCSSRIDSRRDPGQRRARSDRRGRPHVGGAPARDQRAPVTRLAHLKAEQVRAYCLADNKLAL
jgi:hypothetical protein